MKTCFFSSSFRDRKLSVFMYRLCYKKKKNVYMLLEDSSLYSCPPVDAKKGATCTYSFINYYYENTRLFT